MSSIVSLQVRGIRSFGTGERDDGYIKFTSPITLILGQNGCGKTTLIEALKLATTGDVPDNTNKGGGFVHDPKLDNAVESHALVKLQYLDVKGDSIVVCRLMKSTQKPKNLEFKRIDASIKYTCKEKGESKSIGSRCADIDNLVCTSLGVSKAILNSVIFCHQEDSSWPLDESGKVKARFDAIFEAKKYNTFLDDLRKVRNEYKQKLKLLNKDLEYLSVFQKDAVTKRTQLSDLESRMSASRNIIKGLKENLIPVTSRLRELSEKESIMGKINSEYEAYKAKLSAIKDTIAHIRSNIHNEFTGTDEELEMAIKNFTTELKKKEDKIGSLDSEIEKISVDIRRNAELVSEEQVKLGQLTRDCERNQERIEARNQALLSLMEDLKISDSIPTMSQLSKDTSEVDRMLGLIYEGLKEQNASVDKIKQELNEKVNDLQAQQDAIREERAKKQNSIDNKKQALAKAESEALKIKADIDEADSSAETLKRLQIKLDRVKNEMADLDKSNNLKSMEEKIIELKAEKELLEDNLNAIDSEVQSLQKLSHQNAEIEMLKESKKKKDNDIQKIKRRHENTLKHLLGNIPEYGIKMQLNAAINKLTDEINVNADKIKNCEKEIALMEAEKKHVFDKLRSSKQALASDECSIEQACGQKNYDSFLSELSNKIQELQDKRGTWNASEHMFKKYVKQLEVRDPCCPLCHRDFSSENEVSNLIGELSLKVREIPSNLRSNKDKLDEYQEKYSKLLQLKPKYEKLSNLKNVEIPSLQGDLEKLEVALEDANSKLSTMQVELSGPKEDEEMAKNIFSDITILEQLINECKNLDREIQKLESKLPSGSGKRNLNEALSEQKDARMKLSLARDSIEDMQSKMASVAARRTQLHEEKNSLQSQQMKVSGNYQMRAQLVEKLEEVESVSGALQVEIDEDNDNLTQLNIKLEEFGRNLKTLSASNEAILKRSNNKLKQLEQKVNDLSRNHKLISEFEQGGGTDKMKQTQKQLSNLQSTGDSLNVKIEDFKSEKDQIKIHISSQKVRERELVDSVTLRAKLVEEKNLTDKVKEFSAKIGSLDYNSLERERSKLRQEEERIIREKSHAEGRLRELDNSVESLKIEINKEQFKNAESNYKKKMIEIKVEEVAIDDLAKYYTALDWALNHFHTEKMKTINETIKDLWRQIYKGNDIDYIAIDTENDVAACVDKKRVYNYRVVQVKNNVKLDMRGRCSAGQKVLACLIIRIALSETFSSNCGVLALDEPTTNLDHENISSLTDALVEIIQSRSRQKNFQLIVITHDKTFLEILHRVDKARFYYEIYRNRDGKSRVKKMSVENDYEDEDL